MNITKEIEPENQNKWTIFFQGEEKDEDYLRKITKKTYTIVQNQKSKIKHLRELICKQKTCPAKAQLLKKWIKDENNSKPKESLFQKIQNDEIIEMTLYLSTIQHKEDCPYKKNFGEISQKDDLFSNKDFQRLVASKDPPTLVIKTWNEERKKNGLEEIKETPDLKREISIRRYMMKEKKSEEQNESIAIENIEELKKEVSKLTFDVKKLPTITSTNLFVAGSQFIDDDFTIILTSKALLDNYVMQGKHAPKFLCIDGTYKLNEIRYPTIIVGTVDKERKFHLGK